MATLDQVRDLMGKMHEERGQLFAALKEMPEERAIAANPELGGEDGWSVKEILVLMHFAIEDEHIVIMDDFPLDTEAWEQFFSPPAAFE